MYLRNVILVAIVLAMASFGQTLAVLDAPYQVSFAANLSAGESYIDVVNTGANGAPILGPGFATTVGNICVNFYAIDPGEELDSCCSCLVTPDQVVHLGVNGNLLAVTANGIKPTSVTVKAVASWDIVGGATQCAFSAATIGGVPVGAGKAFVAQALITGSSFAAWRTTLHLAPGSTSTYVTTEAPFIPASLGTIAVTGNTELASLVNRCAGIIGNLSGSGICTGCASGALGASKM